MLRKWRRVLDNDSNTIFVANSKKMGAKVLWTLGEYQLKLLRSVLQNPLGAVKESGVPNNCLSMIIAHKSTATRFEISK